MTTDTRPLRVAIIGGGCAGMAAAFELTQPIHAGRYAVTLYQTGWRLGGKGASGRGAAGRIEEHGLHVWMGYYENAFRMMRDCYAELGPGTGTCPVLTWQDAFSAANFVGTADQRSDSSWVPWTVHFPPTPGLPGDALPGERFSVGDYIVRALQLIRTLFETLSTEGHPAGSPDTTSSEQLAATLRRVTGVAALAGLGALLEALRALEAAVRMVAPQQSETLLRTLDLIKSAAREQLERYTAAREDLRRLWDIVDLALATIRGAIRHQLAFDPRGFDAIDDYDCREWLRLNGAAERSINSPFVRALYDLAFAYEGGDPNRPRIAAGTAIRASLRAFFTYRGAFFWKMNGGMGDIVFAPLYEVLLRRGVRFEFFHRLRDVRTARDTDGSRFVQSLDFDVQATMADAAGYRPLIDVNGLPSWPAEPLWDQLRNGEILREAGVRFESHWETQREELRTLRVGDDFDFVILAVGVAALPFVCTQMLQEDAAFRRMIEHSKTVPTRAFQLWLKRPMSELGWPGKPVSLSGFLPPFDSWADMTHLVPLETWPEKPGAIAYFCSALEDRQISSAADAEAAHEAVRQSVVGFMDGPLSHIWPPTASGFPWQELLVPPGWAEPELLGADRIASQFWTANVNPSDRYTLALPGSIQHRVSPLDRQYDNLTFAGDWTACGLNVGCVEAAVMSGKLAAHALSQWPPLEAIIGYDHP